MSNVLCFKNSSFFEEELPEQPSVRGADFRTLMDLCFAHGDRFSLSRHGWAGAKDGALEQALRPYCLGEYDSYRCNVWFEKEQREKCYLYPATEETKAILLQYIPHLFATEESPVSEEHEAFLEQKYRLYHRLAEAADEMLTDFMDRMGPELTEEDYLAYQKEVFQEARAQWLQVFDEGDFDSCMDDPCFFQGDIMFFRTISHEWDCCVCPPSPAFEAQLRALGDWVDWSEQVTLPLLSLKEAPGFRLYEAL